MYRKKEEDKKISVQTKHDYMNIEKKQILVACSIMELKMEQHDKKRSASWYCSNS